MAKEINNVKYTYSYCIRQGVKPYISQIDNRLSFPFRFINKPRCTAVIVGYISNNIIRVFYHPPVAPRDCIARMDKLDPFQQNAVRNQTIVLRQICQHTIYSYLREIGSQVAKRTIHKRIKIALCANVEGYDILYRNQILNSLQNI